MDHTVAHADPPSIIDYDHTLGAHVLQRRYTQQTGAVCTIYVCVLGRTDASAIDWKCVKIRFEMYNGRAAHSEYKADICLRHTVCLCVSLCCSIFSCVDRGFIMQWCSSLFLCVCVCASVSFFQILPAAVEHGGNQRCVCLCVRYKAAMLTYLSLSDTTLPAC